SADGELAENPTVGELVIKDNWIAIVVGLASAAESRPQCVSGCRACNQSPCRFVENSKGRIYPLHVLGRADGAVSVRWSAIYGEGKTAVSETVKTEVDCWSQARWSNRRCPLMYGVGCFWRLKAGSQRQKADRFGFVQK